MNFVVGEKRQGLTYVFTSSEPLTTLQFAYSILSQLALSRSALVASSSSMHAVTATETPMQEEQVDQEKTNQEDDVEQ